MLSVIMLSVIMLSVVMLNVVILSVVAPWQAIEWSPRNVLHLGRICPYPKTLNLTAKACQGQTI
jgi:hypothetical protein